MNIYWNLQYNSSPGTEYGLRYYTGYYILRAKEAVDERVSVEHNFSTADVAPQANHGIHLPGSSRSYFLTGLSDYTSEHPTTRPDGSTPLDSDDTGRLWVYDESASYNNIAIFDGTDWVNAAKNFFDSFVIDNDVIVDDTPSFSDSITVNGTKLSTYGVSGSITLANLETYVLPSGIYMFIGNTSVYVEISNDSLVWQTAKTRLQNGCVISDGVHMRLRNVSGGPSVTTYYRRVGD